MASTAIANSGLLHPTEVFTRAPSYVNMSTMGATGVLLAIPANVNYVRLAANIDCYIAWGGTTVDPGGHATGLGSELLPYGTELYRQITSTGVTTAISALSTAAGIISQSWWSI